jgi:hypothetical protein
MKQKRKKKNNNSVNIVFLVIFSPEKRARAFLFSQTQLRKKKRTEGECVYMLFLWPPVIGSGGSGVVERKKKWTTRREYKMALRSRQTRGLKTVKEKGEKGLSSPSVCC